MEARDPVVAASTHPPFRRAAPADPGITEKMLTQQLRELEEDDIVHRRVYATVPPKVEHSLTQYGGSLERALQAICDWGRIHMKRIDAVEKVLRASMKETSEKDSGKRKSKT
jgi:DNA-binding HxlR family transcriptional regulator